MPINYSKWDALELSDDSDIEVHPNVDKRSFIRAKQNQIHQQREQRRHRITTLKYERVVNEGLLSRIDALLKQLEQRRAEVESKEEVDETVFDCLMEISSDGSLGEDHPPRAPAGVHINEEQPSYSKMMGALVDQVKTEVDKQPEKPEGVQRYDAFILEIKNHLYRVQGLQRDLNAELVKLEKEEGAKITSESIHTGFDSSHVSKDSIVPPTMTKAAKTSNSSQPELLNPKALDSGGQTSGADADVEDGVIGAAPDEASNDEDMKASPTAKRFGKIAFGDYQASLQFISQHPEILVERETDGLLVEAFNAQSDATSHTGSQKKKGEEYSRQCVHQALLLQYCRQLGRDGVGLFFKRIQTPHHQARKMFLDDVNSTYSRIRTRTAELAKQKEEDGDGDREQIQLHAVDPGTTINIVTPPPADQCQDEDERAAREIFDTFPPGLQRALESGSLDKVNEVLGKMSVDEAEQIVGQLGEGGMLSLEQGVIDATTEEGRRQVEEIGKAGQIPGQAADLAQSGEAGVVDESQEAENLAVDEVA